MREFLVPILLFAGAHVAFLGIAAQMYLIAQ
jgi:hypothetical protein